MNNKQQNRRKAVMSRSIKLGHCVCDPRQPCPCDIFKKYNVCQCAGEKMEVPSGPVALTRHVRKAGCASKIGQADLLRVLGRLPAVDDPNVLLGTAAGDDAGIYLLRDDLALVQTVDVFTPCVDDAAMFGRIAAANSLSDVYAMGGKPVSALSIIGFPIDTLPDTAMQEMLVGGMESLRQASCALIGGHSINDEEIKLGFAVTGVIDPQKVVARAGAQPGDVLVLTKPLGTGMIAFAMQLDQAQKDEQELAASWMAALNRDAAEVMMECGVHGCTDITGFGLAGHLVEMARSSATIIEIDLEKLPVYPAVERCLVQGLMSGAIERNAEYAMGWVHPADECPADILPILYDPQTSGGLMVALPAARAEEYVSKMRERGNMATTAVGRVLPLEGAGEGCIHVRGSRLNNRISAQPPDAMQGSG